MHEQGGTIAIFLEERDQMIELRVQDSGSGIPEELIDQIFQPFMTTKGALGGSSTPGTGLGLAISYGIVQSHNGTIDVVSQVGVGTTMIIRIPIVYDTEESDLRQPTQNAPHSLRILVVDDDPQVLSAIAQLLTQRGHRVRAMPDGATALHTYRSEPFDLVLSDAVMPEMDGLVLMRHLQEINQHVHVLAMTGQAGSPQADQMLQHGAIGLLLKPFTIEELTAMLPPRSAILDLTPRAHPSTRRV
jgi:two-component system NtrC family sensor kinase